MSGKLNISSGYESVQGRRWSMEDTHVAIDNLHEVINTVESGRFSFYAVYDGHGGKDCAKIAEEYIHKFLVAEKHFTEGQYEMAFKAAFERADNLVKAQSKALGWRNGSTAVCALIADNTLYVANAGDSEGLLARKNGQGYEPILLTQIHRPSNEQERKRVEEAGGHILCGRIAGSLAVSRALGDIDFKQPNNKSVGDWVVATPYTISLQLGEDDEFLVIACDGLWDKLTYADAVELVLNAKKSGKNPIEAADLIVKTSLERGSIDNITAIVVYLR